MDPVNWILRQTNRGGWVLEETSPPDGRHTGPFATAEQAENHRRNFIAEMDRRNSTAVCPVRTHALPQPYCHPLPAGYVGIALDSQLPGCRHACTRWTHGMAVILENYCDVAAVQKIVNELVGDYPVSVTLSGGDTVVAWIDPDAPGAITADWIRAAGMKEQKT